MAKLTIFFLVIFLAVLSLLSFFNKETVDVTVWNGVTYEAVPVIALIFISASAGIISMFLITAVRDAKRHITNWQITKRQKKEASVLESYAKGREAFFAARYKDASELFAKVLDYNPAHLDSLLRSGDGAFYDKDLNKAREYYLKALDIKPKGIEALLSLERVAEAQQKWQEAIKFIDNILDIDNDNTMLLHKKRDIYERNRKWEDLLEVQNKILKCKLQPEEEERENKQLLGYKYELGRHYVEAGLLEKAIKILRNVIRADKNFTAAYILLADAYRKDGNSKEARTVLLKGYEETSSMLCLVSLEDNFINEGEPGAIIDIYQKAVQKDQKDLRLQFFLAKLYYRLEMIDYALDTLNTIDITAFDYPDVHMLLGSVYSRRSDYRKAAEEFRKALSVDRPLLVPYCCSNCDYISKEWSGRCPECKNWNTFNLDIHEICKIQKRHSSS